VKAYQKRFLNFMTRVVFNYDFNHHIDVIKLNRALDQEEYTATLVRMKSISEMNFMLRGSNIENIAQGKKSKLTDADNILESQYDGKTAGTRLMQNKQSANSHNQNMYSLNGHNSDDDESDNVFGHHSNRQSKKLQSNRKSKDSR
jgi:hypothetical protein